MNRIVLAASVGCSLLFGVAAHANDSAFQAVGGSMRPMKGQHSSVRMESESIVVDAYKDRYDTTVDFVFHNTGKKNIATMGFPESAYGDVADSGNKSTFLKFSTSVDGVPFKATRTLSKDNSEQDYDAYWVKVVPFNKGQRRRVQVKYSSPYGGTAMLGFSRAIQYVFTGGNWKSDVTRSDMTVRVHTPGRWLLMTMWSEGEKESQAIGWTQRGHVFTRSWRNWEAEGNILLGLVPSRAGWLLNKSVATDKTSFMGRAVLKSVEFKVPGKVGGSLEPFEGFPVAGYVQNNVTFVELSHADSEIGTRGGDSTNGPKVTRGWDAKTKTRTLIVGDKLNAKRFAWREGKSSWMVNGKTVALPAAPFVIGGNLYVPAAPLFNALGGRVSSNSAAHWLDITFPAAG